MKIVNFHVQQKSEKFDPQALDASVKVAQTKVVQLGLDQFEEASLALAIGPTDINISMAEVPDEEGTEGEPEE